MVFNTYTNSVWSLGHLKPKALCPTTTQYCRSNRLKYRMSYLKTLTTEQLGQNGFDFSREDPNIAVSRLYPNLSVRHRCKKCGNWSMTTNGKCPQCFIDRKPVKPTLQNYKVYTRCCADENCMVRADALRFLRAAEMETKWTDQDGFSENISLKSILSWSEDKRNAFFDELNEFTVSNYGGHLIVHPGSKRKSKLPRNRKKSPI